MLFAEYIKAGVVEHETLESSFGEDELGTDLGIVEPKARVFRGGERSSEESSRDIGLLSDDELEDVKSIGTQETHFQSKGWLRVLLLLSEVHFL